MAGLRLFIQQKILNLILSYSNAAVHSLNEQARQVLKDRSILGADEFEFKQEVRDISDKPLGKKEFVRITHTDEVLGIMGGEQAKVVKIARNGDVVIKTNDKRKITIPAHLKAYIERTRLQAVAFSQGDRVIFGRSDETIGIKNGDVGTISKINHKKMTVTLDSGQKVKVPKKYKQLNYAYAMTVHKSQGMSVENTSVLIDSSLWDRALSFVAFTRHKQSLKVYTNSYINHDIDTLSKNLSQQSIQDNVIDYPLNFGQRYGFPVDKLVSNAIKKLSQFGQTIPDKLKQVFAHEQTRANQQQSINEDYVNGSILPYIKEYQALIDKRKYMTGYFAEKIDKKITKLTEKMLQNPDMLNQVKKHYPEKYHSINWLSKAKKEKESYREL